MQPAKTSKADKPDAAAAKSSAKADAIMDALAQIKKKYGDGAIMEMGDTHSVQIEKVSSGSLSLDIADLELQRTVTKRETEIALDKKAQETRLTMLQAEVQAVVDKAKAVSPDLVAALSAFGERAMVEKVAQSMAPLSIIGGDSVIDVLRKLLEGTNLAKQLSLPESSTNGSTRSKSTHA